MVEYSVQHVLDSAGFTSYQKWHLMFTQYASMVCGMHTFVMVFLVLEPLVVCRNPDSPLCETELNLHQYCSATIEEKKQYAIVSITQLSEFFGFDCSTYWNISLIGVTYFIGSSFGTLFLGGLADKFGRKFVFLWSNIFLVVLSLASVFPTNFWAFLPFRLAHGAMSGALFLTGFIYETELLPTYMNSVVGCLNQAAFAVGYMFLALGAYLWPAWSDVCLIPALFSLPLIPWTIFRAEESPQWHASKNDVDGARNALKNVIAGSPFVTQLNEGRIVPQWTGAGKAPFYIVCSTKALFLTFLRMSLLWIFTTCCYYGLSTSAEYIGGSVYVNTAVLAFMEIPAQFLAEWASQAKGHKNAVTLLMLAASFSCCGFLTPFSFLAKGSVLAAQLCATAGFTVIYIYAAEVYPTEARSICIGATSSFGRIGAMSSMSIRRAGLINANIPVMCWGLCGLGSSVVAYNLPDTTGMKPPETVEEFCHRFGGAAAEEANEEQTKLTV